MEASRSHNWTRITFNPGDKAHLREIDKANALPDHSIHRTRWIKPVKKKRPGQTRLSRLDICSVKTWPEKMKRESVLVQLESNSIWVISSPTRAVPANPISCQPGYAWFSPPNGTSKTMTRWPLYAMPVQYFERVYFFFFLNLIH